MRPEYSRHSYSVSDSASQGEFTWKKRLIIALMMATVFYSLSIILAAFGHLILFPLAAVTTIAAGYGTAIFLNCP